MTASCSHLGAKAHKLEKNCVDMALERNGNGKEFGISKYLQHVFVYIST